MRKKSSASGMRIQITPSANSGRIAIESDLEAGIGPRMLRLTIFAAVVSMVIFFRAPLAAFLFQAH